MSSLTATARRLLAEARKVLESKLPPPRKVRIWDVICGRVRSADLGEAEQEFYRSLFQRRPYSERDDPIEEAIRLAGLPDPNVSKSGPVETGGQR
jgi:hypothetical protein